MDVDTRAVAQEVSTGQLPDWRTVQELVHQAWTRNSGCGGGKIADYIPALASADPDRFAVCLTSVGGRLAQAGDSTDAFSIQSISKAFVYALVCESIGHGTVLGRVGVNNTGLPFNSVVAVELNDGSPMNPMVNAGAIATCALIPAEDSRQRWTRIREGLSAFAGRPLELDEQVYRSESLTNRRNRALAELLASYGRLDVDPAETVDVYTRQCSLLVTAHDLSIMGATLADGGVNPVTGRRVVAESVARDTLAVMASTGMYEMSGEWLFEIGLPAKSGVSGGIVAISPGKGAIGTFSPRLDAAGNSIRGQRAMSFLSRALGLNIFASTS
ncbi:MAG: glutaminase A [Propionibacterium sp.]